MLRSSKSVTKMDVDNHGSFAELGILCNILVCLAVWLTLSARTAQACVNSDRFCVI